MGVKSWGTEGVSAHLGWVGIGLALWVLDVCWDLLHGVSGTLQLVSFVMNFLSCFLIVKSLNPSLARTALFLLNCQCFDKSIFLLIFLYLYEVDSSLLARYQIMQCCSEVIEFWNCRRGWQSMWIDRGDVFPPGLFILVLGPSSVSAPSGLWRRMRNWQWLTGTITTLWGRMGLKHRSGTSWNWKLSRLPSKSDMGAPSPFSRQTETWIYALPLYWKLDNQGLFMLLHHNLAFCVKR